MSISEMSFIDTNVLVYAADHSSPFHKRSVDLRERGLSGDIPLCLSPQVLSELFAVLTHPKRVNNPLSQGEALAEIEKYYRSVSIKKIYQGPAAFEIMLDLLKRYEVSRQDIFDLQAVATMLANKVTRIYTFNRHHFEAFEEVEVLTP